MRSGGMRVVLSRIVRIYQTPRGSNGALYCCISVNNETLAHQKRKKESSQQEEMEALGGKMFHRCDDDEEEV